MRALEGKITLITGAKGGLGNSVTEFFLAAGAKVVGVSRSIEASDFSHPEFVGGHVNHESRGIARAVHFNAHAGFLAGRFL